MTSLKEQLQANILRREAKYESYVFNKLNSMLDEKSILGYFSNDKVTVHIDIDTDGFSKSFYEKIVVKWFTEVFFSKPDYKEMFDYRFGNTTVGSFTVILLLKRWF